MAETNTVKMVMSSSPHITGPRTTQNIMLDVCIALVPSCIVAVLFFGIFALINILLCVGFCVLFEFLYCKMRKKKSTISDCSAIVTGLILAMNLPAAVPFYVPLLGSAFAILLTKMLFGGLGKNWANPAAAARVFLLLSFTTVMTRYYIAPITNLGDFFNFELFKLLPANVDGEVLDGIMSATPLAESNMLKVPLWKLFVGNVGGSMGETSVIAILVGAIYLSAKKVIDFRIPLACLISVALFTFLMFKGNVNEKLLAIPYYLLSGGIMFGAFFMITDYSSSPNGFLAQLIFAVIVGFFAVFIRVYSSMPEGMSFAILVGNIIAPLLDKWIVPKPFGYKKERAKK